MKNIDYRRFILRLYFLLSLTLLFVSLIYTDNNTRSGNDLKETEKLKSMGSFRPSNELVGIYIETYTSTKGVIMHFCDGSQDTVSRKPLRDYVRNDRYVQVHQSYAVHRDYSCLEEDHDGQWIVYTLDDRSFPVHPTYRPNITQAIRDRCNADD